MAKYIKFGIVSIRELLYEAIKQENKQLLDKIIWHDFAYNLLHGESLETDAFVISYSKQKQELIELTLKAKSNIPIIDAIVLELYDTGFLENRERLCLAYFLIKQLNMDWRVGAKLFANFLIDYDPIINCFNWQWVAEDYKEESVWRESALLDAECEFIKRKIKQLKDVPSEHIHQWYTYYKNYGINYGAPII